MKPRVKMAICVQSLKKIAGMAGDHLCNQDYRDQAMLALWMLGEMPEIESWLSDNGIIPKVEE